MCSLVRFGVFALSEADLAAPPSGLSAAGLTIMVLSIGSVLTLLIWTYGKVFEHREQDDSAGP